MTIRKGSSYGSQAPLPKGSPIVTSDGELREILVASRARGETDVVVGLLGGDLWKTFGGNGSVARLESEEAVTVPVDLIIATIDETDVPAVAHLIAGRLFGKNFVAVMNAQWLGQLDLGPRSHPGDGLLDITTGSLPWRERRTALKRAETGTHLPHPSLSYQRAKTAEFRFDRPTDLLIDGSLQYRARSLSVRVEIDAYSVVV